MRILYVGDIFGKPGRKAVKGLVPKIVKEEGVDLVLANAENVSNGSGINHKQLKELWKTDIKACTSGNHTWGYKDIYKFIDEEKMLVRPANMPEPCPGKGYIVFEHNGVKIALINLIGRTYMNNFECPFRTSDRILAELDESVSVKIIDFHAEATSEKVALSWYLDGKVTLIVGTHTHVQTADERILPGGTGAISDLGMTGPHDSVIGMNKDVVIEKFLTGRPSRFIPAKDDIWLHGIICDIDESGKTTSIKRVRTKLEEE